MNRTLNIAKKKKIKIKRKKISKEKQKKKKGFQNSQNFLKELQVSSWDHNPGFDNQRA